MCLHLGGVVVGDMGPALLEALDEVLVGDLQVIGPHRDVLHIHDAGGSLRPVNCRPPRQCDGKGRLHLQREVQILHGSVDELHHPVWHDVALLAHRVELLHEVHAGIEVLPRPLTLDGGQEGLLGSVVVAILEVKMRDGCSSAGSPRRQAALLLPRRDGILAAVVREGEDVGALGPVLDGQVARASLNDDLGSSLVVLGRRHATHH
mmetsp:Transcript_14976/g.58673  ORF Transcript_14976/g.58673 Transcript_14976/m.58673 type:complete len:206 (-) Transcript_14976:113-730(-)